LAFTKQQKEKIVSQYENWLSKSSAMFIIEYTNMNMKTVDELRKSVREVGGEAHVVKNTLIAIAMKNAGFEFSKPMEGTSLVGFAFEDAPALAKVFSEATKADAFSLKGGFLDKKELSLEEVKALAELPPLPVMQATLLGTIMAPASKLVRTIAEPARGLAAVVKAFSEKENMAPAAG